MKVDDVVVGVDRVSWSADEQHIEVSLLLRAPDGSERPWLMRLYPPAGPMLAADLGEFLGFGESLPDEPGMGPASQRQH